MYQVSTLQALALGYSRSVITVRDLLQHGNTGLGTFEDVNGEMIVMDGHCYRADQEGKITEVASNMGVPFAAVGTLSYTAKAAAVHQVGRSSFQSFQSFSLANIPNIEALRIELTRKIEERFGLNSMHIIKIEGHFDKIDARSEAPYRSQHISLKEILGRTQKAFLFENIAGALVGVYFPDYMDGINMPGWHLHFLSADKTKGGHVFDMALREGVAMIDKETRIILELPKEAAFDTYSLKAGEELTAEIKSVE